MKEDHTKLRGRCEYRLKKHWPNRSIPLDLLTVKEIPIRKTGAADLTFNNPNFILHATDQKTQ